MAYVACGRHAALAFAQTRPEDVRRVLVAGEAAGLDRLPLDLPSAVVIEQREPAELDRLVGGVPHQGIVVLGEPPPGLDPGAIRPERHGLVLVLDGLTDPRNVGAILRTAAAAGVGAILMSRDRAPGLSPALVKAAAGAVEWVPIARVVNLARALRDLRDAGYWVLGLDGEGEQDLYEPDAILGPPTALVAGAEGRGLRSLTQRVCHRLLRIPMAGGVESLNVSVAVALALFEIRRHGTPVPAPP